ncbi:MAG: hypothetical protein IPG90_05510 [Bacteroidetes bacterium]|nr:hypothetical protein [Bacteroidota bacterium]MBK9542381.1 hypothetical protein [Bacteroidota bacterium]
MLQLLISILMAFGLTYDANSGKIKVTQDVVTKAQTISNYNELGGDAALYEIVEVGPKTNDDVVITQQVDPTAKQ